MFKKNNKKNIIENVILLIIFIKKFNKKPKIAVLGLNPHCESNYFNEDEKIKSSLLLIF